MIKIWIQVNDYQRYRQINTSRRTQRSLLRSMPLTTEEIAPESIRLRRRHRCFTPRTSGARAYSDNFYSLLSILLFSKDLILRSIHWVTFALALARCGCVINLIRCALSVRQLECWCSSFISTFLTLRVGRTNEVRVLDCVVWALYLFPEY